MEAVNRLSANVGDDEYNRYFTSGGGDYIISDKIKKQKQKKTKKEYWTIDFLLCLIKYLGII